MTSRGKQLLVSGIRAEKEIADSLRERGWRVNPFGFGDAAPHKDLGDLLRLRPNHECLLKYAPDFHAAWEDDLSLQLLIEAKSSKRSADTGRYDIERNSLEAAAHFQYISAIDTLFVFHDLWTFTVHDLHVHSVPGPATENGSGDPYWLIQKRYGRPLDHVLGQIKRRHRHVPEMTA